MAISTPGIGSNLDVSGIVSKLMAVEAQPLTALQKKEASYQAKLTAYSVLKGALSSFQNSVSGLADASKFQTMSAAASDTSILSAVGASNAIPGNYSISVSALAQSQTITSGGQSSLTSAIGSGASTTLTFQFGTISGGSLAGGVYSGATFAQDSAQATKNVVIDSSNNSLQGIRDAINNAGVDVTASIVNDGNATSPYRLILTSNSTGVARSMKITSSGGDASVSSLLSYDPAGTQNLTQTAAAQNALLSINGLPVTSTSNSVTGAISGVTLNLSKAGSTTLSVANNTAAVTTAIQGLVTSYNSINTTLNTFTRYNSTSKTAGLLLGDSSMQMIQSRIRSGLSTALSGLGSNTLANLSQVGLSFQKDGSLTLDNGKLQSALSSNFGDFASLFAAYGKTTDSLVNYVNATGNTKAGSYSVSVTSLATQGKVIGSAPATQDMLTGSAAANLTITAGSNNQIRVTVNGGMAISVALTAGTYASADALAAQVQTDVNSALTTAGQSGRVNVSHSSGRLHITSDLFGASSSVSITNDPGFPSNTGATSLLGTTPTSSRVANINAGVNDQLTVGVSGSTATVTLAPGRYTASTLASQIQSQLNGNASFSGNGTSSVTVTESSGILTITSNRYGMTSAVSLGGGNAATALFGSSPTSTLGTDVAGKINGVTAVGSGQFLSGATGDGSDGLRVQIAGGVTGDRGKINFSTGYAYNLNRFLDDALSSSGSIASSTDNMNRNIADLQKRAAALNVQLTATEKRYRTQFAALDTLIGKMNTTSTFLSQQLANLPSANNK